MNKTKTTKDMLSRGVGITKDGKHVPYDEVFNDGKHLERMIEWQQVAEHYRDKLAAAEYFNVVQEMFNTLSDARTELKYRTDGSGTVKHTMARIDAVQQRYLKAKQKA